jgi:hypothetical protein
VLRTDPAKKGKEGMRGSGEEVLWDKLVFKFLDNLTQGHEILFTDF